MALDRGAIKQHLQDIDSAKVPRVRGEILETLSRELLRSVPGCHVIRNVKSPLGAEEIDLVVGNDRRPGGLRLLPPVFCVECRARARPVDSRSISSFVNVLQNRAVTVGIVISTQGITGDRDKLTHAHSVVMQAAASGIRILSLTTEDISALASTSDLVDLIQHCFLKAAGSGWIGSSD
ncbi:restriction endonuclease [Phytoactinopolyspora endophytica]|uniref:restriction endonuclease n=1 Tax=Phytoactinopolyspora endophytica TaxID=1642495 RepID=UPI00101C80BE|nr:restriction endonuclease [Phytoactinopolyspora endophytica]